MPKFLSKPLFLIVPVFLVLAGWVIMQKGNSCNPLCLPKDLSGNYENNEKLALFNESKVNVPPLVSEALAKEDKQVLGIADSNQKWIEVDLSEQKLKAWDGNNLFLETAVSTGLPRTPTPVGEFRVWFKLRYTKMEGGEGKYYYYLPNVPYVMFFENSQVPGYKGYSLHGTYWHNSFGTPRSHGCVNLPTPIAEKIYYWISPVLSEGKRNVRASEDNPGTRIVIHE